MPAEGAAGADETPIPERISLTPFDEAFLASSPSYEEAEWRLDEAPLTFAPPVRVPSPERRAAALRLFFIIGGGAVLILVLALLRVLAQQL